jgi:ADP-ribosylglycohydrolase
MGAFVGDALGLGCHWYYDLDELHRDYGSWIDGYTTPKKGRYHEGMKAGQLSQSGLITKMLLESVVAKNGYDQDDFTRRLDDDLFPLLDDTPFSGPGGYTSQSIRKAYDRRVKEKTPWSRAGNHADTTEAAERALVLASLYAHSPRRVAESVYANTMLTQTDEAVVAMTVAYCSVLGRLVAGEKLDAAISGKLMALAEAGELPFHAASDDDSNPGLGGFASPDALLTPGYMARAAADPGIKIEPAWKVSLVYGMPCAIYHQLPPAYYLAARFGDDFESAVLHAINGGGQNMARAMLTGALVGAQVGLARIPARFLEGLENGPGLVQLANQMGGLTAGVYGDGSIP